MSMPGIGIFTGFDLFTDGVAGKVMRAQMCGAGVDAMPKLLPDGMFCVNHSILESRVGNFARSNSKSFP